MQMVVGCQDYDFRELEKVRQIISSLLVVCSSLFSRVGDWGRSNWIAIHTSLRAVKITEIKVFWHNIIQMVRYLQDLKERLLYNCQYSLLSAICKGVFKRIE